MLVIIYYSNNTIIGFLGSVLDFVLKHIEFSLHILREKIWDHDFCSVSWLQNLLVWDARQNKHCSCLILLGLCTGLTFGLSDFFLFYCWFRLAGLFRGKGCRSASVCEFYMEKFLDSIPGTPARRCLGGKSVVKA